jgi:hypothetical protein
MGKLESTAVQPHLVPRRGRRVETSREVPGARMHGASSSENRQAIFLPRRILQAAGLRQPLLQRYKLHVKAKGLKPGFSLDRLKG